MAEAGAALEPFEIDVPDDVLADLRRRLAATRWPGAPARSGWEHGADLDYMKELVAYWREHFDWRAAEARLNRLPQFTAEVDGTRLHLVYEKGSGAEPMPLILTHGWPGSFAEFAELVAPLAHPERHGGDEADAFDVVVPSLPGYGFSARPEAPVGPRQVARLWHRLMSGVLGYRRYGAQGGDWGAVISSWLALDRRDAVAGLHLNMIGLRPDLGADAPALAPEEQDWIERARGQARRETAYQQIHSTRFQTLAFSLADSPAGLAAWMVEKFHRWGDVQGDIESRFSKDVLLTNLTLYWATGTADSATWIYHAARRDGDLALGPGERVEAPTGFAVFPVDLVPPPPRRWAERAYNVVHWSEMPAGGHFAALEEGPRLVDDIRAFFRPLR